jgi:hypothetical protein
LKSLVAAEAIERGEPADGEVGVSAEELTGCLLRSDWAILRDGTVREAAPRNNLGWSVLRKAVSVAGVIGCAGLALWFGCTGREKAQRLKAELRTQGERFALEEVDPRPPVTNEPVIVLMQSLAPGLDALGKGDGAQPVEHGGLGAL